LTFFLWHRGKTFWSVRRELIIVKEFIVVKSVTERKYFRSTLFLIETEQRGTLLFLKDRANNDRISKDDKLEVQMESCLKVILGLDISNSGMD